MDKETHHDELKLGPLEDDKPVKVTIELPDAVHRSLKAYAELLAHTNGVAGSTVDPARLIVPMTERFMATDRAFTKIRRANTQPGSASAVRSR